MGSQDDKAIRSWDLRITASQDQRIKGPQDHKIIGPQDRRIRGSEDHRIRSRSDPIKNFCFLTTLSPRSNPLSPAHSAFIEKQLCKVSNVNKQIYFRGKPVLPQCLGSLGTLRARTAIFAQLSKSSGHLLWLWRGPSPVEATATKTQPGFAACGFGMLPLVDT